MAEEEATAGRAQAPHQQPQQGLSPYLQPGGRGGAAAGSPYLQGAKVNPWTELQCPTGSIVYVSGGPAYIDSQIPLDDALPL